MVVDINSSVSELRTLIEIKRQEALDLQTKTNDTDEWNRLNEIRWRLADLDNDLYRSHFHKNDDLVEKLIDEIKSAGQDTKKIVKTLDVAKTKLHTAREKLKEVSSLFSELESFYKETEELLESLES